MVYLQTATHQKLKWLLQNGDLSVWPEVESKNWPFTKIGTKRDKFKWKYTRFAGTKIIEVTGNIMGLKRMVRSGDKMYVTGMSVSFIVNWFVCLSPPTDWLSVEGWVIDKTNFHFFSSLHYCTLCLFTAEGWGYCNCEDGCHKQWCVWLVWGSRVSNYILGSKGF